MERKNLELIRAHLRSLERQGLVAAPLCYRAGSGRRMRAIVGAQRYTAAGGSEKCGSTARHDQTGRTSTGDGRGNAYRAKQPVHLAVDAVDFIVEDRGY
jgi:hypothetical protein